MSIKTINFPGSSGLREGSLPPVKQEVWQTCRCLGSHSFARQVAEVGGGEPQRVSSSLVWTYSEERGRDINRTAQQCSPSLQRRKSRRERRCMQTPPLPLRGRQKPLKPKEEQVQGLRVVFVPTGKSISSAQLLCRTWHLKGGISRCLRGGRAIWRSLRAGTEQSWFMAPAQALPQAWGPGGGNATAARGRHSRLSANTAGWEGCCKPSVHGPPARAGPPTTLSCERPGLWGGRFLLRHHDVTTRVGTGPRQTSSWTGSTLVQNIGSELSAFPWDIRASVTPPWGAPLTTALPGSV